MSFQKFLSRATGTKQLSDALKADTNITEQEMTPEEKALLESQMAQYGDMEKMAPVQLAQMGYVKGVDGNVRPLTDQEAKTILAPDQYALFQAKQQDAAALANGTLPDYMKREMDAQNNQILGAANRRLGPGGYYTSTPGNQAMAQVAQNIGDVTGRNRERQLGLLSGYYGLNAGISDQVTKPGQGLLTSGQSIAKNMIQPFHEWSSNNRQTVSQVRGGLGQAGIQGLSSVVGSIMGGMGGGSSKK